MLGHKTTAKEHNLNNFGEVRRNVNRNTTTLTPRGHAPRTVNAGQNRDMLVRQTGQDRARPAIAGRAVLRRLATLPTAMALETSQKKRLVGLDDAAQALRLRRRKRGEQAVAPASSRKAADGHVGALDDLRQRRS